MCSTGRDLHPLGNRISSPCITKASRGVPVSKPAPDTLVSNPHVVIHARITPRTMLVPAVQIIDRDLGSVEQVDDPLVHTPGYCAQQHGKVDALDHDCSFRVLMMSSNWKLITNSWMLMHTVMVLLLVNSRGSWYYPLQGRCVVSFTATTDGVL